jgi:hypothetical protein
MASEAGSWPTMLRQRLRRPHWMIRHEGDGASTGEAVQQSAATEGEAWPGS